ncbi:MAG: hypothetical protein ACPGYT_00660 [Nitrospirales bacterium]
MSLNSRDFQDSSMTEASSDNIGHMIHALANKLLPITVFSELALRHCNDPKVIREIEKIHRAAEEARELILEYRRGNRSESNVLVSNPLHGA